MISNSIKRFLLFSILIGSKLIFTQIQYPIIPYPLDLKQNKGEFILDSKVSIISDISLYEATYLKKVLKESCGLDLAVKNPIQRDSKIIYLLIDSARNKQGSSEGYTLLIHPNTIKVIASTRQGLFYGIQSLMQLIPHETLNAIKLPCLEIKDQPKFRWRGMHLDVSRHFFPKEDIKKYIDHLARYKMNVFHWHLTDDQGWRIEIKKHPKLTTIGAWRKGSMIGHYNQQQFDSISYGGFYTQEDIKEIVNYAKERHITIIPEIEMPGHAMAALAAYPEYSCTKGPFEVAKNWGVLDDVFCPKEETFTFLESILAEVIDLFPSEYIHIGGDECPKVRWKKCASCQQIIKDKNLKDEHELQSYFIKRIESYMNSRGRKIIGWDEILEGGLAPNAAVMSWRGTEGGIEAAKLKHPVVMSPGSHCYFDHYQGNPKNEPLAIGGYTPVDKVYAYNPIPDQLNREEAQYILGGQANMWTEYIHKFKDVEYMMFPRMLALSEALWGTARPSDFSEFKKRMFEHFHLMDRRGTQYSKAIFEINYKILPSLSDHAIELELKSAELTDSIRYTLHGDEPNIQSILYTKPIRIHENITLKASVFKNNKQQGTTIVEKFYISKSTGRKIDLLYPPHESYYANGAFTLIDGVKANRSIYGKDWLGFWGKDLVATIDLLKEENVYEISIGFMSSPGSWIHFPKTIEYYGSSDGDHYQKLGETSSTQISEMKGQVLFIHKGINCRYLKIVARNNGVIADGHPGAGQNAWLFVDEIEVK